MKIDNFALTMFQACPRKYKHRMVDNWTRRRNAPALGFGAALHHGLAAWYAGKGPEAALRAIEAGWDHSAEKPDDHRTLNKCLTVMAEYMRYYPAENFSVVGFPERPVVEESFTLSLGMYLPCVECNNPEQPAEPLCPTCMEPRELIEYGGIFDTLVEFGQQVYILEHKTTSQLGPYFFQQFKPNNQVTGYVWAASELHGKRVNGAMINAIGAFKTGATRFAREITTRNQQEIDEWKENVWLTCIEINTYRQMDRWPQRTPSCTQYGQCEFHQVCSLPDHRYREKMLEENYQKTEWDYTNRDEPPSV